MAEEADLAETAPLIVCDSLVKIYKTKEVEVLALQGLDLTVNRGELMAIIGKSGSGKSTLMNIVGGLEVPSAGRIVVDGQNLAEFTERQMVQYRKKQIGFVWQKSGRNLFPYLNALDNVVTPMLFRKGNKAQKRERAEELLELVGMADRKNSTLRQLSGGEQQRVSIARALAKNPKMLLCDEPTGALDYQTGKAILKLLQDMCRQKGMTVVVITHNSALTPMADRVIKIKNGKVAQMTLNDHPTPVEEIEW